MKLIMEKDCMLSTFDNPYNPFDDFVSWFLFDVEKGYDSCGRLMRIAKLFDDMTQKEIDEETERAIDEIIKYDFTNTYIKVCKTRSKNPDEDSNEEETT